MKKLLAMLLAALMVLSLSAVAFASNSSPAQETEPAPAVVTTTTGDAPAGVAPAAENKAEKEALEGEAEAAKTLEDASAADDAGEEAVVALGKLPADATDEMKDDFDGLLDDLVKAKAALAQNEAGILAEVFPDAEGAAAGQPFRAVAAKYPATITIKVNNPEDYIGMMIWDNGKFVELNCTVNMEESTVTFVLDRPAVICLVNSLLQAP